MTQELLPFDVVILGGGPGGYVAAMRASQLDMRVALIEREQLGGICLNWGCIPSKTILHSAEVLHLIRDAKSLGISVGEVHADYAQALKRARDVAERQARGVAYLMRKYKVEVVHGVGRLLAPTRVHVETQKGPIEIQATEGVIIDTGSSVRWPPTLQPDSKRIISSREVWNVEDLPKSVLLLGAGPIGCEFATVYNAFGVQVTMVEILPRLLPREDPDCSAVLTKEFKKRGINIITSMMLDVAEVYDDGVRVRLVAPPPRQPTQGQDWDTKGTIETTTGQQPAPMDLKVERVMLSAGFVPNR